MARMNLRPDFERFVQTISTKNTYSGQPVSQRIIQMLEIEVRETGGGGVLAPYWLGVFERGRGRRKSTTDSGLWKRIYAWMQARNMFTSKTSKGKINEAKGLTWYINKHGNQQFRSKTFIDIYNTARSQCVASIQEKYSLEIAKITQDIL